MIYSPRVKLQSLRKEYKISQLELVMEKISRSHLAMIETGKTKLSRKIATVLVDNFNEILSNRGVEDRVDLEYILEDEQTQIDKKREIYLEDLSKGILTDTIIAEIEEFIKVADLKSKVLLYTKIADLYYTAGHYKKAHTYYQRSFDDLLVYEDLRLVENSILKLIKINVMNEDHMFNAACGRVIEDKLEDFSKDKFEEVLKLLIQSSMAIGHYKVALRDLEKIEKLTKDKEDLFTIEGDKATCFEGLEDYASAVSIYRGMLLKYSSPQKKLFVSISLMNAFKLKGDLKKVEAYFKKNFALLKKVDVAEFKAEQLARVNFDVAQSALYLEKKDKALDFYMRVINSECINNCQYQLPAMEKILYLADRSDVEFIKRMEDIYISSLAKNKDFSLGYRFLEFYRSNKFEIELNKYLNKQIEFLNVNKA